MSKGASLQYPTDSETAASSVSEIEAAQAEQTVRERLERAEAAVQALGFVGKNIESGVSLLLEASEYKKEAHCNRVRAEHAEKERDDARADNMRWQCVHCGTIGEPQVDREAKWAALIGHRLTCEKALIEWAQMPSRRRKFIHEIRERLEQAEALADRSVKRLVELSESGSIGAFGARDAAIERAERAEKELREIRERIVAAIDSRKDWFFTRDHAAQFRRDIEALLEPK